MTGTGQPKATIVIVDDEQIVVTSIRAFLEMDSEFEVLAFTDVGEAEKCFESRQVDVVVSDYRMPVMNGLQLLARIKQSQPEATRVLLTSHADAESAIKAINEVSLYQYLEKPWDNEQLLLVVRSAAERSRILRELSGKIHELDLAHHRLKDVQKRLIHAFL
jgi:DNA-binding NtrC family response regulator